MRIVRTVVLVSALSLALNGTALAADFYVSQSGTGGGTSCSDTLSVTWFNTGSNWANPKVTGKVGPGDTVHLCGTFTFPANGNPNNPADLLVIPGSGSSGSLITVKFETNAIVQSPAFSTSGGLDCNYYFGCHGYIVIDGGTNGLIQATNNGSASLGFGYQIDGNGVFVAGWNGHPVTNVEIKNLTVQHIYQHDGSPSSSDAISENGSAIAVTGGSNIHIHNNVAGGQRQGIAFSFSGWSGLSGLEIDHNTVTDMCFGILVVSGGGATDSLSNPLIHDNEITNWDNYKCPATSGSGYCTYANAHGLDPYHKDGIIVWTPQGNSNPFQVYVYNNYIHGDLTPGSTAFVYGTWGGGSGACVVPTQLYVFNNLFVSTANITEVATRDDLCSFSPVVTGPHFYYNNTFVGTDTSNANLLAVNGLPGNTVENNVFTTTNAVLSYNATITTSNYNVFFNTGSQIVEGPGANYTLAQWQGMGYDLNSVTTNPNLTADYTLGSGSSAVGLGANLTSLCTGSLAALCTDKAGNPRPATGAWDAGAYQFSATNRPNPPVALRVTSVK